MYSEPFCQLKEELKLKGDEDTIHRELIVLAKSELIEWHVDDHLFRGLQQGTINLVLRHRFKEDIAQNQADPGLYLSFQEQAAELQQKNEILQDKINRLKEHIPTTKILESSNSGYFQKFMPGIPPQFNSLTTIAFVMI
ncbi:MAG: hypothetical protein GY754_05185 [bacterium]|nr:hypothetical protein [bacterium]